MLNFNPLHDNPTECRFKILREVNPQSLNFSWQIDDGFGTISGMDNNLVDAQLNLQNWFQTSQALGRSVNKAILIFQPFSQSQILWKFLKSQ